MTTLTQQLHAVQFDNRGNGPIAGPVSVLAAHLDGFLADTNGGKGLKVDRVYFNRSNRVSWSFAKNWWSANTGRMSRIGAGAYGDATIWKSADAADHKFVWR